MCASEESHVSVCCKSVDGLCEPSTLCEYYRKNVDLFVLNIARVWHCALVSGSDMLINGTVACTSLFIFLVLKYVVTVLMSISFMLDFCLSWDSVGFSCI